MFPKQSIPMIDSSGYSLLNAFLPAVIHEKHSHYAETTPTLPYENQTYPKIHYWSSETSIANNGDFYRSLPIG